MGTVLGRNCAQLEPWDTGRAVSSNLNVNQLDKLNHSHFLASTSAPKHLSSYPLFLLSLFPQSEMVLAITSGLGGVECVEIFQSFTDLDTDRSVFPGGNLSLSLLSDHSQSTFQETK